MFSSSLKVYLICLLSPTISNLSFKTTILPHPLDSFSGGDLLVISGHGFGVSGAEIKIGSAKCEVEVQTDTEIKCTIPANFPGVYYIELTVTDQGFAAVYVNLSL